MTDELPDLSADHAAIVARWPLPAGVPDALVNKAQLETALGVSQTTISAYLRQGLPFVEAGTNGRSYVFRLSVAFAWQAARRADDDAARAAGDRAAAQLQMALLGGDTASPVGGKMSLADQRKLIELELIRNEAARKRGDLIWRDDAVSVVEGAFAAIRDALDALPDRLRWELGLDGPATERVQTAADDALAAAAIAVDRFLGGGDDGDAG